MAIFSVRASFSAPERTGASRQAAERIWGHDGLSRSRGPGGSPTHADAAGSPDDAKPRRLGRCIRK
jgi:hypothetical protein